MSKHSWVHDNVDKDTPLTADNFHNVATTITYNREYYLDDVCYYSPLTPNISHDKLVPLICERCGGNINKDTYKCEHCGTQYEWR